MHQENEHGRFFFFENPKIFIQKNQEKSHDERKMWATHSGPALPLGELGNCTQNPKNFTFLSSLQSPLFSLLSLWFSALRLSQVSTAHLTVSGSEVQESGIKL